MFLSVTYSIGLFSLFRSQESKGCFDLFSSRRLSTLSACDGVHFLLRCIQESVNNKYIAVHTG